MNTAVIFYRLLKKELAEIFFSPRALFSALFFFSVIALLFLGSDYWFAARIADLQFFFLNMPLVAMFVIPVNVMALFSSEKKAYTDRLLSTFPISRAQTVYAKYSAQLIFFFVLIFMSASIPLSVFPLGNFSFAVFMLSYFGVFLFFSAVIALAISGAALFDHAAGNFFASFLLVLFFSFIHVFAAAFEFSPPIKFFLQAISLSKHFESFALGIFDSRDVVFYVLFTFLALELSVFIVKHRSFRQ